MNRPMNSALPKSATELTWETCLEHLDTRIEEFKALPKTRKDPPFIDALNDVQNVLREAKLECPEELQNRNAALVFFGQLGRGFAFIGTIILLSPPIIYIVTRWFSYWT